MTTTVAPERHADEHTTAEPAGRRSDRRRWWLAILGLALLYVAIGVMHDPRGSLGTDTGGKLATVEVMKANGSWNPDVGYWAVGADPDGDLHPLYYTSNIDGAWINVTTLPMILAAKPLADVGGLRFVMALPLLGGLLCACAAALLAKRLDERATWWVFWIVGVASPVVVYATDFWEHALGLGFMLSACLCCFDVALRRKGIWTAAGAGACFGVAATMRTEAMVYCAVALLAMVVQVRVRDRGWSRAVAAGIASASATLVVLLANQVLERVVIGESIRSGRAAGTLAESGSTVFVRLKEALIATVGLNGFGQRDLVVGAVFVACTIGGVALLTSTEQVRRRLGVVLFVLAGLLLLARTKQGLGFVPGLLTASPFAIVGLAAGWRRCDDRFVFVLACVPVPLVWATQYSGGALPQWGARYQLLTGALLAVLGVIALLRLRTRGPLFAVLILAASVTTFGIAFSSVRSHDVANAMQVIDASQRPVISREQHLLREGGAFFRSDKKWLTAESDAELRRAVHLMNDEQVGAFDVLQFSGRAIPDEQGGHPLTGKRTVEFVPGVLVDVLTYG